MVGVRGGFDLGSLPQQAVLLDAEVYFARIRSPPFAALAQAGENGCSWPAGTFEAKAGCPKDARQPAFFISAIPKVLPIR